MVDRRSKREPLQHITGHAPFRYLDLKVGPGVFIPRQETELVVQEGVDWITKHGMYSAKVVDLCGAIGLSFVTEVPGSEVWAVEKSEQTAQWTRVNLNETAKKYPSIASNYHLEIADATQTPTLNQLDGTIDIVLTNPPCLLRIFRSNRKYATTIPILRYTAVPQMARLFRNALSPVPQNC